VELRWGTVAVGFGDLERGAGSVPQADSATEKMAAEGWQVALLQAESLRVGYDASAYACARVSIIVRTECEKCGRNAAGCASPLGTAAVMLLGCVPAFILKQDCYASAYRWTE
jgi:hypothetical protein